MAEREAKKPNKKKRAAAAAIMDEDDDEEDVRVPLIQRKGTVPSIMISEAKEEKEEFNLQSMLEMIDLAEYISKFEEEKIDGNTLLLLNESDLKDLGLPMGPRKKIVNSIVEGKWDPFVGARKEEEEVKEEIIELSVDEMRELEGGRRRRRSAPDKRGRALVLDDGDEIYLDKPRRRSSRSRSRSPSASPAHSPRADLETGPAKMGGMITVMLAHKWKEGKDPSGWHMSEKLDGVRCYWNGKQTLSRNGNRFFAPDFFIKDFPKDTTLDGELWLGRQKFQDVMSIVRRKDDTNPNWSKLQYRVFDIPGHDKQPFEWRLKKMKEIVEKANSPYLIFHPHEICRNGEHLMGEMDKVTNAGGEGMMLRQPGSLYEHRRSHALLKVKKFHDAEATVIGHDRGEGRNAFVTGALVCTMSNGVQFRCGSGLSDADRRNPPKIGSKITFRYFEITKGGHPRFPTFVRRYEAV